MCSAVPGRGRPGPDDVSPVHWHPSVILGLAALVAGYALARRAAPRAEAGGPRDVALFLAGGLAMAAALVGPLDDWAEHAALSAHMTQHLVLTLVVPPLWLAATPPGVWRPILAVPGARAAGRALTRPPVALGLA